MEELQKLLWSIEKDIESQYSEGDYGEGYDAALRAVAADIRQRLEFPPPAYR